jgi:hypothetical protein
MHKLLEFEMQTLISHHLRFKQKSSLGSQNRELSSSNLGGPFKRGYQNVRTWIYSQNNRDFKEMIFVIGVHVDKVSFQ